MKSAKAAAKIGVINENGNEMAAAMAYGGWRKRCGEKTESA
jgi:hypothetical protein